MECDIDCGFVNQRNNFQARILTLEDREEVVKLISEFLKSEPMCIKVNLSEKARYDSAMVWFDLIIPLGFSIGFICKETSQIVGIQLNQLTSEDQASDSSDVDDKISPELQPILSLLDGLYDTIFKEFKVKEYFDFFIVYVSPSHRNMRISQEMIAISEWISANTRDGVLVIAQATGHFSYLAFLKRHFSMLREMKYDTWVNPMTTKTTFQGMPVPHTHVRTMYKFLHATKTSNN